eukprot:scaffold137015_cov73-Cyclotella_meneghiniana.AAC.4
MLPLAAVTSVKTEAIWSNLMLAKVDFNSCLRFPLEFGDGDEWLWKGAQDSHGGCLMVRGVT